MKARKLLVATIGIATAAFGCSNGDSGPTGSSGNLMAADDDMPVDAANTDATRSDGTSDAPRDTLVDAFYEWPTPPASLDYAPACGVDGVTYWNDEQAAAKGVASTSGACLGVKPCGPSIASGCPAGSVCIGRYLYITPTNCSMSGDWSGDCWSIPPGAKCPTTDKPSYLDCTTSTCATYCDVVRGVRSYRMDKSCP